MFALPARLRGLGVTNPAQALIQHYKTTVAMTAPLVDLLVSEKSAGWLNVYCVQLDIKNKCQKPSRLDLQSKADQLCKSLLGHLALAVDLACQKGASSWLTAIPLSEHNFSLHNSDFPDALALRYRWYLLTCYCHVYVEQTSQWSMLSIVTWWHTISQTL